MEGNSEKRKVISFGEPCPKCGESVTHQNTIFRREEGMIKYVHSCGNNFNELVNGKICSV